MSDPNIPTPEQLADKRLESWHQHGDALLTMEAVLPWLQRCGLVLFAPRGQQFVTPSPTFVEATLGTANASPTVAEREGARGLLQRLVSEGQALPLNLLGEPSTTADNPDFVVSVAAFPYLFTLRGDKAWKQAPMSSGPFKVSPLAVNTYTLLAEAGPRTASDLVNELGKGLTETAVLRALSELWQHLRVFPVGQADGTTSWELATARFTKAIKSGANAGQPTALSALITLYLGQALLATEDEIEVFLSPLAPRSRVRDVLHALTAARELDSIVIEGKHSLHVAGDLPVFLAEPEMPGAEEPVPAAVADRITKFAGGSRPAASGKARSTRTDSRERRPFERRGPANRPQREPSSGNSPAAKRVFHRPWEEERQNRKSFDAASSTGPKTEGKLPDVDLDAGAPTPRGPRPRTDSIGSKRPFTGRKAPFGARKSGSDTRTQAGGFKPSPRSDREGRPAYRRSEDRPSGDTRSARAPGAGGSGTFDRPRRSDFSARPGGDRSTFSKRPSSNRPFQPREAQGPSGFPQRSDDGAAKRSGFNGERRPESGARERGAPSPGGYGPRSQADGKRPQKRFTSKPEGDRTRDSSGRPPFERKAKPFGARPTRPGSDRGPAAGGPFDKFKGGNKPWGKRPPARKIKPEEDKG